MFDKCQNIYWRDRSILCASCTKNQSNDKLTMATLVNQILIAIVDAFTNVDDTNNCEFRSQSETIAHADNLNIAVMSSLEDSTEFGSGDNDNRQEIEVDIFVYGDSSGELSNSVIDEIHRILACDFEVNALLAEIRELSMSWKQEASKTAADVVSSVNEMRYLPSEKRLTQQMQ
jgi:hypothetical protein